MKTCVHFLALSCLITATVLPAATTDRHHRETPTSKSVSQAEYVPLPVTDIIDRAVARSDTYSLPLGDPIPTNSPGVAIGYTWYDKQRNASMRRMIGTGTHGTPETLLVHFSWMYLPGRDIGTGRSYYYRAYYANNDSLNWGCRVQPENQYAGYVVLDVTNDDRAVVGGHNNFDPPSGQYQPQIYWDACPGCCLFSYDSRIPDSVAEYGQAIQETSPSNGYIWPGMRYVEGPTDTVTHVIAQESNDNPGDPQAIAYFRKVGANEFGTWDYPPYVVDTVHNLAQDLDATDDGMVVLAWVANLPDTNDPCNGGDTCSSDGNDGMVAANQWNNDVYLQISTDYGVTFRPRINVTKYEFLQPGYRAYNDLSVLIDSRDVVHVVWGASSWIGNNPTSLFFRGRMFHWDNLEQQITTVHDYEWDQTACNGGAWNLNAAKMSLSECDGKMYVLFVQFNDPEIMMDDCASETSPGHPGGAANGDLYVTVSDDWGLCWDKARNITNSHTPGCDSVNGPGGPCDSDVWPSMTRFGTNYVGDFSSADIVDPTGSYAGNYFLDVQYVNDHSAGAIISGEGFWHQADIRWFRLACVEPVDVPAVDLSLTGIDYPTHTAHGLPLDTPVIVTNAGNGELTYSLSIEEDAGPAGWLAVNGFSGSAGCVPFNTDTGIVTLNANGVINDPGTVVAVTGRVIVSSNAPDSPDTIPVHLLVLDTLVLPEWDTIQTACTRLAVSNHGAAGGRGDSVNLDYMVLGGDCTGNNDPDTLADNADVYLYDASPVICYVVEGDTDCFYSAYSSLISDTNTFIPLGGQSKYDSAGAQIYKSGVFITADSNVAFEKVWYAPKNDVQNCSFVLQKVRVWLEDTTAILTDVRIGEFMDWNIPADTGARNYDGFDTDLKLIYQQGSDEDGEGCQPQDTRWGGISFLNYYVNGVIVGYGYPFIEPYGAFTREFHRDIDFWGIPNEDTLYTYMASSGMALSDSDNTDLYTVMTFDTLSTLAPGDTLVFYAALATHHNGTLQDFKDEVLAARYWYCNNFCYFVPCLPDGIAGDLDHDCTFGCITVSDASYLVAYLFQNGPPPLEWEEGNTDGDCTFGCINVADLAYLVDYLFNDGPAPLPCVSY